MRQSIKRVWIGYAIPSHVRSFEQLYVVSLDSLTAGEYEPAPRCFTVLIK